MWGGPDARAFIIFVCLLATAEYFIQIRWRLSVVCRACGFDPVLYVKSPHQALQEVKLRLSERRQHSSEALLRPLHLPSISPERARELAKLAEMRKAKPGVIVSRQI